MGHYLILHIIYAVLHERSINLHLLCGTSKIPFIFHMKNIKIIILLPNPEITDE